ncbi:MAG TPA: DUF5683 domain-containing protein [Flavobacterium sp.]
MKFTAIIALCLTFLCTGNLLAQQTELVVAQDSVSKDAIDPLRPSKAAFYSAIVPGLGQAYNKDYWKIPIVYGGIGLSLYSYSVNNTKYHNFREAYKRRLAGFQDDAYQGILNDSRLISAQRFHQRNRDLSMLVAVALYALNIVEANVAAHLKQFNVNENLSMAPHVYQDELTYKPQVGFAINYRFK